MEIPFRIAIASGKGGTGKSTIALLLRDSFEVLGYTAGIRDWDSQGSVSKLLATSPECLAGVGAEHDIIIADCPPDMEHPATISAIREANLVLVIVSPSPLDILEAARSVQHVTHHNSTVPIRLVVNKYRDRTVLSQLLEGQLERQETPACATWISERESVKRAAVEGLNTLVSESKAEINALAQEVLELQGVTHG